MPGSALANVNGLAVASLVVSIVSFIALPLAPVSLAGGIVALVLGYRSKKQVDRSGAPGRRNLPRSPSHVLQALQPRHDTKSELRPETGA
jgi:hypothetical protein